MPSANRVVECAFIPKANQREKKKKKKKKKKKENEYIHESSSWGIDEMFAIP